VLLVNSPDKAVTPWLSRVQSRLG